MPGRRTEQRDRLSAHGAAMSEAVMVCFLGAILSLGLVMLFGDDVRALFASADNSLAGLDSTPATRVASGPWRSTLAGLRSNSGSSTGSVPALSVKKSLIQEALRQTLRNRDAVRHGDWQRPVNVARHIHKVGLQSNGLNAPPKWKLAMGGLYNGGVGILKSLARLPETAGRFSALSREVNGLLFPDWMLGIFSPNPAPFFLLARGVEVGGIRVPGFNAAAEALGEHQQNLAQKHQTFQALALHAEKFNDIGRRMWDQKTLTPLSEVDADMAVGAVFTAAPSLLVTLLSGGTAALGAASKVEAAARFGRAAMTAGTLLEGLAYADDVMDFETKMQQLTGDPNFHVPEHEFVAATTAVALVAGSAEALGGKMVWHSLPGADKSIGALMTRMLSRSASATNAMVMEGTTETFQEWTANLAKMTYDPSANGTDGLLQAFFGGLGSSGVVSVPGSAANGLAALYGGIEVKEFGGVTSNVDTKVPPPPVPIQVPTLRPSEFSGQTVWVKTGNGKLVDGQVSGPALGNRLVIHLTEDVSIQHDGTYQRTDVAIFDSTDILRPGSEVDVFVEGQWRTGRMLKANKPGDGQVLVDITDGLGKASLSPDQVQGRPFKVPRNLVVVKREDGSLQTGVIRHRKHFESIEVEIAGPDGTSKMSRVFEGARGNGDAIRIGAHVDIDGGKSHGRVMGAGPDGLLVQLDNVHSDYIVVPFGRLRYQDGFGTAYGFDKKNGGHPVLIEPDNSSPLSQMNNRLTEQWGVGISENQKILSRDKAAGEFDFDNSQIYGNSRLRSRGVPGPIESHEIQHARQDILMFEEGGHLFYGQADRIGPKFRVAGLPQNYCKAFSFDELWAYAHGVLDDLPNVNHGLNTGEKIARQISLLAEEVVDRMRAGKLKYAESEERIGYKFKGEEKIGKVRTISISSIFAGGLAGGLSLRFSLPKEVRTVTKQVVVDHLERIRDAADRIGEKMREIQAETDRAARIKMARELRSLARRLLITDPDYNLPR